MTLADTERALDILRVAIDDEVAALAGVDAIGPLDVAGALAVAARRQDFHITAPVLEEAAHRAIADLLGEPASAAALARADEEVRASISVRLEVLKRSAAQLNKAELRANSVLQARARVLSAYARALRPAPSAYDARGRAPSRARVETTCSQTA
ncbi:MAG TPA: hypothetical protein VGO62_02930 [Myxococcota bacterium]|jgi:hypothetical protein